MIYYSKVTVVTAVDGRTPPCVRSIYSRMLFYRRFFDFLASLTSSKDDFLFIRLIIIMQMFVGSFVGRRCLCLGFVLINVFAVLSLGRNAISRGPAVGTYLFILYFILLSLYIVYYTV